ncbi:uncharacterized protein [Drosophila bipectinata]|uniref:uncharacterized protein isoform X2 n=1 Tax=Drosophila bipectinata TaxID=42026 RepID=UPI0038B29772
MFLFRVFSRRGKANANSSTEAPVVPNETTTTTTTTTRKTRKTRAPRKKTKKATPGSAKKALKGKPSLKINKKLAVTYMRSRAMKPKSVAKKLSKAAAKKAAAKKAAKKAVRDVSFIDESVDENVPSFTTVLGRSLDSSTDMDIGEPCACCSSGSKKKASKPRKPAGTSKGGVTKKKATSKPKKVAATRKQIQDAMEN